VSEFITIEEQWLKRDGLIVKRTRILGGNGKWYEQIVPEYLSPFILNTAGRFDIPSR
jgi:hypothetical protein